MSSASNNVIHWFESAALDDPTLRSPQPCKRGIHCDYKLTDEASGELVRACCSGVHPGEEGTGRRLFPARTLDDGREQPACVRLTGASQGFYERRRLRLSWAEWCEMHEIPFTPALPGQPFEPVVRKPLGGRRPQELQQPQETYCPPLPVIVAAPTKLSKNQRKRANKKARATAIACEDLEAELSAGAHSPKPKPDILQPMEFGQANTSGGMCTPGCFCFSGGVCGDRLGYNDDFATPFLTPALMPICPVLIAEDASARNPRQILASCYCGAKDCTCFDARRAEYDANTSSAIFLRRSAEQKAVGGSSEAKDDGHSKECVCINCCSDEELVARRKRAVRASGGSFYQWVMSGSSGAKGYHHSRDCRCITCQPDEKFVAPVARKPAKDVSGRFAALAGPRIPPANEITASAPQPPAPLNLLAGFNTTVNNEGPSTYDEGISPYIPVVPGPRPVVIPEPPTPLNLLAGYNTPAEEDDNGCSTPTLLHNSVNDEDENETPMLSPTLIPNQNLEELD